VAKRNAAIHAARRLILGRFLGQRNHEFEAANPVGGRHIAPVTPVNFKELRYLAHVTQYSPRVRERKVATKEFGIRASVLDRLGRRKAGLHRAEERPPRRRGRLRA
jgi:hypothetical protein